LTGRTRPSLPAEPLADFPLDGAPGGTEPSSASVAPHEAAPLSQRARALAADVAAVLLAVAACLLAAVAVTERGPRLEGLAWAAAFGVLLSLLATVASLVMFGRTVGMALAGLEVGGAGDARNLAPGEALRRWIGTAATAASLGLPLLWTARDAAAPTLADRLSGRPLRPEAAGLS
jgi:hypothetical protein